MKDQWDRNLVMLCFTNWTATLEGVLKKQEDEKQD